RAPSFPLRSDSQGQNSEPVSAPVGMFVVISERRHGLRILPLTVRSEWKTRRGKHLAIGPIPGGPHAAFEAQTCKTMMGQKALCFEVVQVRHFESPTCNAPEHDAYDRLL